MLKLCLVCIIIHNISLFANFLRKKNMQNMIKCRQHKHKEFLNQTGLNTKPYTKLQFSVPLLKSGKFPLEMLYSAYG